MGHVPDRSPLDDESARRLAVAAHDAYDRLVRTRPDEPHQSLSEALRCLVRLRDGIMARARAGDSSPVLRERLQQVNAVVSLAFACQIPIVGVKWSRMEETRDALKDLIDHQGS